MTTTDRDGGRTRKSGGKLTHVGPESDLLTVDNVAALLACSARTVWRMSDAAAMPPPVRFLSLVRWRRRDVDQWLSDGCPKMDRGSR